MNPVHVAIVGASGYTGEELVRWLLKHPRVALKAVTSRQFKGMSLEEILGPVPGASALLFEDLTAEEVAQRAEVVFLALPHGVASEYAIPLRKAGKIVIDLSADFRLRSAAVYKEFYAHEHPAPALLSEAVYANPVLHRDQIRKSDLLASPGCYPTSILLALAPVLQAKLIDPASLVISSLSGVSGAGKKSEVSLLYCEVNESMKAYGVPKHRHLSEIEQEIAWLSGVAQTPPVTFVPHLIPLSRGMLTTITANVLNSSAVTDFQKVFEDYYRNEPFVSVLRGSALPEVKSVVRTNWIQLAVRFDSRTGRVLIFSAIDNLVKGAGGQAIQAMNIRLGFPEEEGLLA